MAAKLDERQLLWVDLDHREPEAIAAVAAAVGIGEALQARLADATERADLTQHHDHIHLVLEAMEDPDPDPDRDPVPTAEPTAPPTRRALDVVAGRDWVLTVHDGPLRALARLDATTEGETRLGALDAAAFLASIVDEVIAGYFELVEHIEREIDALDERALRRGRQNDILERIVAMRRRIGSIRRTLAPHRVAFAALARPEMELYEALGRPWPGLMDRLERALDAVENLRELLLGTFDIHMGRATQDANEVMKVLTLISAVFLPSVVLAGIMGMNFPMPFFENMELFVVVVAVMGALAAGMVVSARARGWI